MTNRLANETSPYLLQHKDNPVDWYPWGEEALAKAREEDKPILLSVGYSACHWCHVMERESFEDEATARMMNEHFVNIKVDREERPDIDSIYMSAVQALTRGGGWPMTVFLTPDGAALSLLSELDRRFGGFGGAPKFPQAMNLEVLLRHHHRTGDGEALSGVETTLRAMANGGIYDQLGGGFARYSVDRYWLVPHLEKMLYDNALLSPPYLEADQA